MTDDDSKCKGPSGDQNPQHRHEIRLVPFTRKLLPETVAMIKDVEKDAVYLEGLRSAEVNIPLRAKLWHAVFCFFREHYAHDIAEARLNRMRSIAAQKAKPQPNS